MSDRPQSIALDESAPGVRGRVLVSSAGREGEELPLAQVELQPYEAIWIELLPLTEASKPFELSLV